MKRRIFLKEDFQEEIKIDENYSKGCDKYRRQARKIREQNNKVYKWRHFHWKFLKRFETTYWKGTLYTLENQPRMTNTKTYSSKIIGLRRKKSFDNQAKKTKCFNTERVLYCQQTLTTLYARRKCMTYLRYPKQEHVSHGFYI